MSDPTFGKTPGAEIMADGRHFKTCRCGESILVGQVRDALSGRAKWRVWDALPLEHNGRRWYTGHRCVKD